MVIVIGAVVTVLYVLLGVYLVRISGLGVASSVVGTVFTPVFTLYVPLAIILTNVIAVGLYSSSEFRSMNFVYINIVPAVVVMSHVIRYFRINSGLQKEQALDSTARKNLQVQLDHIHEAFHDADVRSYVYMSNGQLKGTIIVKCNVQPPDEKVWELERSLPTGIRLEVIVRH